jgi:hypothetical protein
MVVLCLPTDLSLPYVPNSTIKEDNDLLVNHNLDRDSYTTDQSVAEVQ